MSKSFLRNVIGEYMTNLGDLDNKVVIVNADLAGTCRNRGFAQKYPERSFNTGIAEQNMVSFAAGLACEGFKPYAFSMAPFLTMRACEQCRTDVAYGNRNVKLIGVYAGVSGGISGATHWALEDVGIMTSIPNITVFEVSDANQTRSLLKYTLNYNGPTYIRSSVEQTEDIYNEDIEVKAGGSITVKHGNDGATSMASTMWLEIGKHIRVVDLYSLKPIDKDAVIDAARTGHIVAAQDHNVAGGLGSIVGAILAEEGLGVKFKIMGVPDHFMPMAHAPYLYKKFGLNAEGLSNAMINLY